MHPKCVLTIDGQPVSGLFWERLIQVTVTDKEGTRSDTIDFQFEAGTPFVALPRKKSIIQCWLGYAETGIEFMGKFEADEVELEFLPYQIHVQGKSADVRGKLKQHREKHWDNQTFGGVVGELAKEAGLKAQVAPRIAQFRGKDGYFAIGGESPLHWIERHAQRLDGLFAIKNGNLIVADKGAGQTPGGGAVGALVITPPMVIEGTGKVKFTSRDTHKKVKAGYHDHKDAKRKHETADADPKGEADYTMRHTYANKAEAKQAATARAKELQRSADSTGVTIEGNPYAKGGVPFSYAGIHPEVDGMPFIIETATHTFSKGPAYLTAIQGKAKKTQASGGSGKSGGK